MGRQSIDYPLMFVAIMYATVLTTIAFIAHVDLKRI